MSFILLIVRNTIVIFWLQLIYASWRISRETEDHIIFHETLYHVNNQGWISDKQNYLERDSRDQNDPVSIEFCTMKRKYCYSIAYIFQNILFRCGWNCERTDYPPDFDDLLIGCGDRYFEQLFPVYISAGLAWVMRSSNRCWRICCHRRTVTGSIHYSDIGSFFYKCLVN